MNEIRMPDINNVLIAGNLTRDPVFRKTTNGTPVTNFGIASNRRFKDNNGHWRESICYVGVVAWYKLAENCVENLQRGSAVIVEGELQSRTIRSEEGRNRNIVEIKAHRVQFLNKKDQALDEDSDIESGLKKDMAAPAGAESHPAPHPPLEHELHETPELHDVHEHEEVQEQPKLQEPHQPEEPHEQKEHEPEKPNPLSGKFDFGYQDIET